MAQRNDRITDFTSDKCTAIIGMHALCFLSVGSAFDEHISLFVYESIYPISRVHLGTDGNVSIRRRVLPVEDKHRAAQLSLRHHPCALQDGLGRHPEQR